MTAPTIGSLCTGTGALDMAVTSVLGGELEWLSDTDPAAVALLASRHRDVPNLGDITSTDWKGILRPDIITAGFPCQPVSNAGKRKGTTDARWIWPACARAIRVLQPTLAFVENVSGLRKRGFDRVVTDLADAGYDVRWCSLRASAAGAPHRRLRMFILATHPDAHGEPWLQRRLSAPGDTGCWWAYARPARRGGALAAPHPANNGCERPLPTWRRRSGSTDDGGCRTSTDTEGQRRPEGLAAAARFQRRHDVARSGSTAWGRFGTAIRRWEQLTGYPAPEPTAPTGRGGAHRLSARAVEWMMGLPSGHVTDVEGLSRNAQLRLLGNAVVPQQAQIALAHLLSIPTTQD